MNPSTYQLSSTDQGGQYDNHVSSQDFLELFVIRPRKKDIISVY
jgi:hypothetical protein